MAETTIDPAQAETAQAGTGRARVPEEPGPVTADLGTIVSRAARRFGAKTALIAPGRTLTYSELDELCDRVAGGLHGIGVRPGDRVSLYSPNRWEWVIAYHAALRAGAVVNPINVMLTAEEVAFVLNDCGAAAIFTSGDKAEVIAGSTLVLRTDRDVLLTALPLPHVYGNIVMNGTFMAGATLVLMERFDPAQALATIQRHGATVFDGVPTMYAMMLADPSLAGTDLSSLRICGVGGQTMPAAKMAEWERRSGAPLLELWGMTELGGAGTANPVYVPSVHGSIGFALPGAEARVASLDDASVTMPDGEPGELMIRGPLVMLGYYGNEPATRAAIEPDGWMHTGDIATRDEEGRYFVVDRRKDLIITGGFNVYPAEIERVVAAHPAVAMVAVGSVADDTHGELARAYVVLRPGATATEAEIIEHCRPHLAAYKRPRSVRFVPDLPKTSTGKVMRRELKTLDG
jgi:acyl-CoA synthetase (AMP-forming)/AMP-acid ligase II